MNAGGYQDDGYWKALLEEPDLDGATVRRGFVDQTGKPGPLTWREGKPPAGKENHPVSGVSWFEAHAYGKSLFGVLHVTGNVAQWVEDRFQPYPGSGPYRVGVLDRVIRGDFYKGTPESLRATVRTPRSPTDRFAGFGFRCASGYTLTGKRTY